MREISLSRDSAALARGAPREDERAASRLRAFPRARAAPLTAVRLRAGCEPSTSTFTSIISACGRAGDTAKAFALYEDMERRGVPANTATFTTLIAACGATGDAERAFVAMRRMEALKLPPNLYT